VDDPFEKSKLLNSEPIELPSQGLKPIDFSRNGGTTEVVP